MTPAEGRAAEKAFQQRRAGELAEDPVADKEFLDSLVVVLRAADGTFRPARPLTDHERRLHCAGRLLHEVHGVVVTQAAAQELEAQRTAKARSAAVRRARQAEAEARQLTEAAARLG